MVTETFEIVEKEIGPVVEIEENVKVWQMPKTFGRYYEAINNYLLSHDAKCSAMPYARYVDMDWEIEVNRGTLGNLIAVLFKRWHFYAGLPSTKMLPSSGEFKAQEMKTQKYARALHKGPYKDVGPIYKALFEWARTQNVRLKNEAMEFYLNDPSEVKAEDIETEIYIPLI